MLDKEKEILVEWQRATIAYRAMVSMEVTTISWPVEDYFAARKELLTITDSRVSELAKIICSEPPDGYMTMATYRKQMKWKAKVDAAEDKLLTISFEFGDAFSSSKVKN